MGFKHLLALLTWRVEGPHPGVNLDAVFFCYFNILLIILYRSRVEHDCINAGLGHIGKRLFHVYIWKILKPCPEHRILLGLILLAA